MCTCSSGGGSAGGQSFESWLTARHEDWRGKQEALRAWVTSKDREADRMQDELSQVAVVSKVMQAVETMVASAGATGSHLDLSASLRSEGVCG